MSAFNAILSAARFLLIAAIGVVSGCVSTEVSREPQRGSMSAADGRAVVAALLPPGVSDRAGWATGIYAAFAAMEISASPENVCSVVAITEQESTFRTDPA